MTRTRLLAAAVLALVAVVVAVPVVAFVIVPQFVKSTVNEPAPQARPPASVASPGASPESMSATAPEVLAAGMLRRIDPVHYGSGQVQLVRVGDSRFLRFQDVEIAGAPNMFVYLSDRGDGQPGRYTDLGALKATNGSFNYEIPASVNLDSVRAVVVWCRAFSVTVTYAPVGKS